MARFREGVMNCIRHTVRAMLDSWDYEIGGVIPDDNDSDQGSEEDSSGSEYEEQETEMEAEMAEHRALRERGRPLRRA